MSASVLAAALGLGYYMLQRTRRTLPEWCWPEHSPLLDAPRGRLPPQKIKPGAMFTP